MMDLTLRYLSYWYWIRLVNVLYIGKQQMNSRTLWTTVWPTV